MAIERRMLLLVLLAVTLCPAAAQGRTYDVWSCNLPDGTNLPVEGWSAEQRGASSATNNGCSDFVLERDGGLHASFFGNSAPLDYAGWVFTAPVDTTISGYTLWRAAHSAASTDAFQDYYFTHDVPRTVDTRYLVEFCSPYASCSGRGNGGEPFAAVNRVERANLAARRLHAFVVCDALNGAPHCDGSGDVGRFAIFLRGLLSKTLTDQS